jgi:hypothetical protein
MAFLNGKMYIAASNPNVDPNIFPAVDEVTFNGTQVVLTPVLMGNATAIDTMTGLPVTLDEVDPDSMTIDAAGNLVLVNQAGAELVFISNPGPMQTVSRTLVGTQLEDTVWINSAQKGSLLLVDGATGIIYAIRAAWQPGTIYTETPNDSGVSGFFGTISQVNAGIGVAIVTPVAVGFKKATGLTFFPDAVDE